MQIVDSSKGNCSLLNEITQLERVVLQINKSLKTRRGTVVLEAALSSSLWITPSQNICLSWTVHSRIPSWGEVKGFQAWAGESISKRSVGRSSWDVWTDHLPDNPGRAAEINLRCPGCCACSSSADSECHRHRAVIAGAGPGLPGLCLFLSVAWESKTCRKLNN